VWLMGPNSPPTPRMHVTLLSSSRSSATTATSAFWTKIVLSLHLLLRSHQRHHPMVHGVVFERARPLRSA